MKLLFTIFTLILLIIQIECILKSVHIIMRHGIRAPSKAAYPLDPHINDTNRWPNGLSQLTDAGIKQAHTVGKYLRNRYQNFYPKDPKNAIVRSSEVDRCIDTITIVGQKLWPERHIFNWIRPRLFMAPMPMDGVLYEDPYCPALDEAEHNNLNTTEAIAFNNAHQDIYNYVSNNTGLPATINGVYSAFDFLRSEKANCYDLPSWATDYYYNQMQYINFKYYDFEYSGVLVLKLMAGLLLKELSIRMNQVLNSSIQSDRWYKNFFLYATHDSKIFALNKALGLQQITTPPFLAMTILELHQINDNLIIKFFYVNQTESLPIKEIQFKPTFCSNINCPYNEFNSSISYLFPNWKNDCGIPENWDPFPVLEEFLTITDGHISYSP